MFPLTVKLLVNVPENAVSVDDAFTCETNVETPVALKFLVTISAPKVDVVPALVTLIPLTNRFEPSKVKLELSTNLPEALPT